jgi:hypothetical protein
MATPLNRLKRLTENDIVRRMAQSDVQHWLSMNARCPTCLATLDQNGAFNDIYPHMVGECDRELVIVGPEYIRRGRNVNCPLADAKDRREVRAPRIPSVITGTQLFWACVFCAAVGALVLYEIFR